MQGAALNNAGLCHARLGQFERAIALQRQAIQVQAAGAETRLRPGARGDGEHLPSSGRLRAEHRLPAAGVQHRRRSGAGERRRSVRPQPRGRVRRAEPLGRRRAVQPRGGAVCAGKRPGVALCARDGREDCRGSWTIRRGRAPVRRGAGRRGRRARRSVDVSRGAGAARALREPAVGRRPSLRVGVADGGSHPVRPAQGRRPHLVHVAADAVLPRLRGPAVVPGSGRTRPRGRRRQPCPRPRRAPGRVDAHRACDRGGAEATRPQVWQHAAVLLAWRRALVGLDRHR